jgi:hypothetical protein
MRIVIAGGTGFLGTGLVDRLRTTGHTVTVLARRPRREGEVEWNPGGSPTPLARALEGADAVINLAVPRSGGGGRRTNARSGRVASSDLCARRGLEENHTRPGTFISGSPSVFMIAVMNSSLKAVQPATGSLRPRRRGEASPPRRIRGSCCQNCCRPRFERWRASADISCSLLVGGPMDQAAIPLVDSRRLTSMVWA